MAEKRLIPPFSEPMFINNQMSPTWRLFFDEVAKAINRLNELESTNEQSNG